MLKWKVQDTIDNIAPKWMQKPALIKDRSVTFSCGSSDHVYFDLTVDDTNAILVKTEIFDLNKNTSRTYYLCHSNEDALMVGHNVCTGAFIFRESGRYRARFTAVDFAGNKTTTPSDWFDFQFSGSE